jgi:hypothetical protein
MRKEYDSPAALVVHLLQTVRLCSGSDWDVIGPGEDNIQPGTREFELEDE